MKWRLPPTHRVVHNSPTLCRFATELPSICAVNDAFWQQAFDFRPAAVLPGSVTLGKPYGSDGGNRRRGAGFAIRLVEG